LPRTSSMLTALVARPRSPSSAQYQLQNAISLMYTRHYPPARRVH
jgi:hypothetical protein